MIGGAKVINEAAKHQLCEEILVTRVNHAGKCDRFVDSGLLENWKCAELSEGYYENGSTYDFTHWTRH